MKWLIHRVRVDPQGAGLRLDQFLAENCPDLSRTQAKKIVDLGGVHVNGRRVRSCSTATQAGDRIEVYIDHLPLDPYRISNEDILYQDSYIIVLNKPAQIETQPTHARYKGTLYEALHWYLRDASRPHHKTELGMVQRLDRGTSGVLVFSIHPRAHKQMSRIFLEHRVHKRYLALVHGTPDPSAGEIRSQLARSRKENRVRSVAVGGKKAITRYRIAEEGRGCSLLEIELITGRSHQIRAHMAEQGCPLLGDVRYGGRKEQDGLLFGRPLLHSAELGFRHPVLDKELFFEAPLPEDMQTVRQRLLEERES